MTTYIVTIKVRIEHSELGEKGVGDAVEEALDNSDFGKKMWKLGTYADAYVKKVKAIHERT